MCYSVQFFTYISEIQLIQILKTFQLGENTIQHQTCYLSSSSLVYSQHFVQKQVVLLLSLHRAHALTIRPWLQYGTYFSITFRNVSFAHFPSFNHLEFYLFFRFWRFLLVFPLQDLVFHILSSDLYGELFILYSIFFSLFSTLCKSGI